jgi:NAD-dependent dihydropyrimidine dehydrogenase PreA subunit
MTLELDHTSIPVGIDRSSCRECRFLWPCPTRILLDAWRETQKESEL